MLIALILISVSSRKEIRDVESLSKPLKKPIYSEGIPGTTVQIQTSNYDLFSKQYETLDNQLDSNTVMKQHIVPPAYDMNITYIYQYRFVNSDKSGSVRIQFLEFDLNGQSVIKVSAQCNCY